MIEQWESNGIIYTRIWALTLPFAVNVYNLIIARSFMTENIPMELHEAAQLDGCGDFKFFFRVVIPLAKPVICVLLMMYAVEHWNSYFYALIYLKDPTPALLSLCSLSRSISLRAAQVFLIFCYISVFICITLRRF